MVSALFKKHSAKFLLFFLCLAPLFVVTLHWWSSAVLLIGSLASLSLYAAGSGGNNIRLQAKEREAVFFTAAFMLPICAVAFSSVCRWSSHSPDYDGPARFLLAVSIFMYASSVRANALAILEYVIPIGVLSTLIQQFMLPQPMLWSPERMATYFADPLVFGYTSLTMGLMSLLSINALKQDSRLLILLKISGCLAGCFLSVSSGSRTGWAAVPIVILIWLSHRQCILKGKFSLWLVGLLVTSALSLLAFNDIVYDRMSMALNEILTYNWNGLAPETSIGLRITFLRIAIDMFSTHPLSGFGDTALGLSALPPEISSYATKKAIHIALHAGFHNEVVSNTIRYGVGGFLAFTCVMMVPLIIFYLKLNSTIRNQRANALVGIVFVICYLISSLTTEVFDLKYMASFYATLVALLCASAVFAADSD